MRTIKTTLTKSTFQLVGILLLISMALVFVYCTQQIEGSRNQGGFRGPASTNTNEDRVFYTHSTGGNTNGNQFAKSSEILDYEKRWGISAPLEIASYDAFEEFRFGNPYNNEDDIEDFRVYVKLENVPNKDTYFGDVTLSYLDWADQGVVKSITFKSGRDGNARHNFWFYNKDKSEQYFHGFFQNTSQKSEGALILVIDRITNIVDDADDSDGTPKFYGGSVWIMNFRTTFRNQNSCNNHGQKYVWQYNAGIGSLPSLASRDKPCWDIDSGPYDCRTWRSGRGVDPLRAIEPDDNCYEKLATFEGLDIPEAFDESSMRKIKVPQVLK